MRLLWYPGALTFCQLQCLYSESRGGGGEGGGYFEARNGAYLKHSLSGLPFLSSDSGRNRIQGKQV